MANIYIKSLLNSTIYIPEQNRTIKMHNLSPYQPISANDDHLMMSIEECH